MCTDQWYQYALPSGSCLLIELAQTLGISLAFFACRHFLLFPFFCIFSPILPAFIQGRTYTKNKLKKMALRTIAQTKWYVCIQLHGLREIFSLYFVDCNRIESDCFIKMLKFREIAQSKWAGKKKFIPILMGSFSLNTKYTNDIYKYKCKHRHLYLFYLLMIFSLFYSFLWFF